MFLIPFIAEKEDTPPPPFKRPKRAIGHMANFNFFIKISTRRLDCFSPQEDELSNHRGAGSANAGLQGKEEEMEEKEEGGGEGGGRREEGGGRRVGRREPLANITNLTSIL